MFEIEALDFFSSSRLLRILEGSSAPDRECDARRMPPGKLVFPAVPLFYPIYLPFCPPFHRVIWRALVLHLPALPGENIDLRGPFLA
jgi:hypothetical protein